LSFAIISTRSGYTKLRHLEDFYQELDARYGYCGVSALHYLASKRKDLPWHRIRHL